jgi:DNA recombination protein RmuC
MTWVYGAIGFLLVFLGFILGVLASWALRAVGNKRAQHAAEALSLAKEQEVKEEREQLLGLIKNQFESLSLQALSRSSQELVQLAQAQLSAERQLGHQELEHKKAQIEDHLKKMDLSLSSAMTSLHQFERERSEKYGELASQLQFANRQTSALLDTTNSLKEVLVNSKARGYWGERIAEDILQLAGFIENVNYLKQKAQGDGRRPDYTFLLPQNMRLNMDVKFPIDNYLRYVEASNDLEREAYKKSFLRDVKARLRELKGRDYINSQDNTVDCVLMFIPHEQVYAFVQSEDPKLFDEGIRNSVISCSPMTLFAVLAVIRQSVEQFAIERTAGEILKHMAEFKSQWEKYSVKFETLGKKIHETQKEFETLVTTRKRALDRAFDKIESIQGSHIIGKEGSQDQETFIGLTNLPRESSLREI